ncbi:hypothetical protein K435DRAFT_865407 [Dendrothele bispora CBS 962.96]|uniref:Uncharacterized protein n=1 Tax=Dendrothele bispora (strain CBS 962.96) TaxID=1314807 RepID=A0A4S8LJP9_DENBC|nr:hypothetical protein K435DRAFT_865407 [Dendrothele bispora CBS 962.96]
MDNDDIWLQGDEELDLLKKKYPHVQDDDETLAWLVERRARARQRRRAHLAYQRERPRKIAEAKERNERRRQNFLGMTDDEKKVAREAHRSAQARYRMGNEKMLAEKECARRQQKKMAKSLPTVRFSLYDALTKAKMFVLL